MEHVHQFFLQLIDSAGYLGVLFVMIAGNMCIPVGVEIVLPAVGVLTATGHLQSAWIAGLVAVAGELIGGSILFAIGKYAGPLFISHFGRFVHIREQEMQRVHGFYERFGAKTVFISRFIPVIRGIAALPAGASDMPWPKFLLYTAAGSSIFCYALIFLGNKLGRHLDDVMPVVNKLALAVPVLVIVAIVIFVIKRRKEPAT
jgi:membrane protein DedA with SNARE-associated domain